MGFVTIEGASVGRRLAGAGSIVPGFSTRLDMAGFDCPVAEERVRSPRGTTSQTSSAATPAKVTSPTAKGRLSFRRFGMGLNLSTGSMPRFSHETSRLTRQNYRAFRQAV